MREALQNLSGVGSDLAAWCVAMNASTLLLLGMALAADLLIGRRVAPAWRIAVYLPVFLRVVIPAQATWEVPFWKAAAPAVVAACVDSSSSSSSSSAAECGTMMASAASASPAAAGSLWPLGFLGMYVAGVGGLAACWARGARAVRRAVAESRADGELGVLISETAGPMVAGVRRPRVVIPAWLASSEALPLILAHERAHIARRDPAFAFVIRGMCTVAWPLIPVWIASSRVRALMEQACDDRALGAVGKRQQENVMKYARAMIDVAERSTHLSGSLAFGAALRSRIGALCVTRRWPLAAQAGVACVVPLMLAACSAARPQTEAMAPGILGNESVERKESAANAESLPMVPAAKPEEVRVVNVKILTGDEGSACSVDNKWNPSVVIANQELMFAEYAWLQNTRFEAAPRAVVPVGQPMAIGTNVEDRPVSMRVEVLQSSTDSVRANVSYSEGNRYTLKSTDVEFRKGQTCIIRIPSSQMGMPVRTLTVTIDRVEDEVGC